MRRLGQVDEERFTAFMASIGRMEPLTRRETKLVWSLLACFIPSPATAIRLPQPALCGLQALVEATDAGYITDDNPALTQLLVNARLTVKQDSL